MATESFYRKFEITEDSFDCFKKVMDSDKITILNCTKKVKLLDKEEVLKKMKE